MSFLPIFTLEAQEGRLFSPLAYTKTFAMAAAALLSVTLVPALMVVFVRGRIVPEHRNPLNRVLIWLYRPVIAVVLRAKTLTIVTRARHSGAHALARQRGSAREFMPTLNEGTLLYMPTTLPGISVTKAAELLQTQDRIIKTFPEVESVFGKAGRAATATDPAPIEMFETVINLKPKDEWRPGVTIDSLIAEMDKALQFPGVSNAWTMPIKARIDMLSTGIRTPVGVKVFGADLAEMEQVCARDRTASQDRARHVERLRRARHRRLLPRHRARPRAPRPLRPDGRRRAGRRRDGARRRSRHHDRRGPRALHRQRPLSARPARRSARPSPATCWCRCRRAAPSRSGEVASVKLARGATTIRTENGQLAVYVFVDIRDRDLGGYVADAQKAVAAQVKFPPGYYVTWSGQFEYLERAEARLQDRRAGDAADHLPAALPQFPRARPRR